MDTFKVISKKSGETYYLHSKIIELRRKNTQRIYYFARVPTEYAINLIPDGYEVIEMKRTGMPMLKKIR